MDEAPRTDPPAIDGWRPTDPPGAAVAPPSGGRMLVAWVVGGILLVLAGWMTSRVADGPDATRSGYAIGTIISGVALVAIARWVLRRVGAVRGAVLRSPWLPLGAGLLAVVIALGRVASVAPLQPVDATTGLHVAAPYRLTDADPALVQAIGSSFKSAAYGSTAVKSVIAEDGSRSILMVADAGLRDEQLDEVAKGIADTTGSQPTMSTIVGRTVAVVDLEGRVIGTWMTEPLLYAVVAVDRATMQGVIESVIASE